MVILYLVKHVSKIIFWIYPGSHSVTEEYKILFRRTQAFIFSSSTIDNRPNAIFLTLLTCTTPPGFTLIIVQIPLNAESFSSLSLIFRKDVHLPAVDGQIK